LPWQFPADMSREDLARKRLSPVVLFDPLRDRPPQRRALRLARQFPTDAICKTLARKHLTGGRRAYSHTTVCNARPAG